MGSGKGKTRRAKAVAPPTITQGVLYDQRKWREFVGSHELQHVTVRDYYLGGTVSPSAADYARMFSELFQDAVAVGAITLPAPYQAEDFTLTIGPTAHVALRSQPEIRAKLMQPLVYLD